MLESIFLDNLKKYRKIGVAEALSKYLYTNDYHVRHTHNLIGDPEFEIWLHEPECLEVGLHWKNEYILFDNPNKYDGMIVINDGEGNIGIQTYDDSNSAISIPYLNESDKMESVTIFKTGHLPVVKLDCSGQRLINCNKKFVVKDAALGLDKENATDVVISDGANVTIRSIDKTECGKLLRVTHNGNLEIKSDRIVNIDGSAVAETGKMEVSGEKVCISNGFSVKRGGLFSVNKNKELSFTRL